MKFINITLSQVTGYNIMKNERVYKLCVSPACLFLLLDTCRPFLSLGSGKKAAYAQHRMPLRASAHCSACSPVLFIT